jgi:hypothetical protein
MTRGGIVLRLLWIRMMATPFLFRLLLVGLVVLINSGRVVARVDGSAGGGPGRFLENLWRTKAAAYGSYYAADRREVKTLSQ